jgi:16S rRNA A1518/A1519 N6-dimethyltransferase RsmA/KsgA/DIM1 with predicted DNA glycosylase/AP lyase activity
MKRKAHYSQYFLRNPQFVARLLEKTTITHSDHVIDIGAGSGVITSQLAVRAGSVTAIEFDSDAAAVLAGNLKNAENVSLVTGDIMTIELPKGPYKVFANIPFHLSSQIVQRLFFGGNAPLNCYLIVQRQFAEKMIQNKRFNGMLGVQLAPWVESKILYKLERTDFWPHPNVDTVLLSMRPRANALLSNQDMEDFRSFIEQSYSTPAYFKKHVAPLLGDKSLKPSQLPQSGWVNYFNATKKEHHDDNV